MTDDLPMDPVSPLAADAVNLHEGFKALVLAGFSEHQACLVIGAAIGEKAQALQPEDEPHYAEPVYLPVCATCKKPVHFEDESGEWVHG